MRASCFSHCFRARAGQLRFRAAEAVARVVGEQSALHGALGVLLQAPVDGGVHDVAVDIDRVAIAGDHLGARHFRGVPGLQLDVRAVIARRHRRGERGIVRGAIDVAELQHASENPVAPRARAGGVVERIQRRGRFRQAGDQRGLVQGELLDRAPVVDLRGGLDAVGAVAQEDLVEVELEDLLLVELALDLQREQDLVELAHEGLVAAEEVVARDLHRDRAAAGLDAARGRELPRRARQSAEIDAVMAQETIVLGGEHRLDEHLRDLFETHRGTAHLAEFADQQTVAAVDAQRLLEPDVAQHIHRRQPRAQIQQRACDGDHSCGNWRQQHPAQAPAPD